MTQPNLPIDASGEAMQVLFLGTVQKTAFGAGATVLPLAIASTTKIIRVIADEAYHMVMSGTSDTNDTLFPANLPEYLAVRGGETPSFFNDAGASGNFYVTEME